MNLDSFGKEYEVVYDFDELRDDLNYAIIVLNIYPSVSIDKIVTCLYDESYGLIRFDSVNYAYWESLELFGIDTANDITIEHDIETIGKLVHIILPN